MKFNFNGMYDHFDFVKQALLINREIGFDALDFLGMRK